MRIPSVKRACPCLLLPDNARPPYDNKTKKPVKSRASVFILPDSASCCQTLNHSHSIVPGGLPVTS